jgi:holo-[acyl-carrier protein] synthase
MMLLGLGTDIIEIERIQKALARHEERLVKRLFTPQEQAYCEKFEAPWIRYAGRFAAKEAIIKTLGSKLPKVLSWKEIEVLNDATGKPEVYLSSRLKGLLSDYYFLLSISHCAHYATATAILCCE